MIEKGHSIRDLLARPVGTTVNAHGWVKTRRDSKGVHFLQLNDGSGFQDLQVVIEAGQMPEETLARVSTGASLCVAGELVASPGAGLTVELKAREIHVYGTDLVGLERARYDLETGKISSYVLGKYDNC